jgi:hypothetical protein
LVSCYITDLPDTKITSTKNIIYTVFFHYFHHVFISKMCHLFNIDMIEEKINCLSIPTHCQQ